MSLRQKFYGVLLALVLLSTAAWAQESTEVIVNGNPLPAHAVIGSTGSDIAVMATPFLQAAGAQVRVQNGRLEAQWADMYLILEVGKDKGQLDGNAVSLAMPCGALDNDLVVPLRETCKLIKARVEPSRRGLVVWKDNISQGNTASTVPLGNPDGQGGQYPPGFATITGSSQAGSGALPGAGGMAGAPAEAITGRPFPEAGMGGLSSKTDPFSSPYDRPDVSVANVGGYSYTVENPRNINQVTAARSGIGGMGAQLGVDQFGLPTGMTDGTSIGQSGAGSYSPSGAGGAQAPTSSISYGDIPQQKGEATVYNREPSQRVLKPAKPEIVMLDVRRIMTFHYTIYEIKVTVRNEGEIAIERPFMLQISAKGDSSKRYNTYELLESYNIAPLQPGQHVEVVKRVDGHMFSCLTDLSVSFRAQVLEEIKEIDGTGRAFHDSRQRKREAASAPAGMRVASTKTKSLSY